MVLEDRRNEMENRYAHDQETRFRIEARRNKLIGLWAADKLGKSGQEADEYAQSVIKASFEAPGDDDVIGKLKADFAAARIDLGEDAIRAKLAECLGEAERQITGADNG